MPTEKQANLAKEIVAAVIASGIVCTALYMLAHTYSFGGQSFGDEASASGKAMREAYTRQKDMMLYGLSLLGTVLGYYLGRVPAERAEIKAQQEASQTRSQLETTHANLNQTVTELTASEHKRGQLASVTQQLVSESEQMLASKKGGSTLSGTGGETSSLVRSSALEFAIANAQKVLAEEEVNPQTP